MILRIGVLLLCLAVVHGQDPDLDALIKAVFGEDPATTGNTNNVQPPVPRGPNASLEGNSGNKETRGTADVEEDCTCVPYYLCPNGTVLTDGTGLLDIRAKPGACEKYMDVCCKAPLDENHPIKPPPTVRKGCGQRHPDGVGFRITGDRDNEAQFGEFPWMVALLKRTVMIDGTDLMVYQCGGALIHERVVLTTAHCVTGDNDGTELLARAGEWDTQTTNEIYRHQNEKVAKVVVHPRFRPNNLHNDYALLILEKPFKLGDNIDTVCLPSSGVVPLSRECYATGWGKDKFDEEDEPRTLHSWHHNRRRIPRHLSALLSGIQDGVRSILDGLQIRGAVGSVWPSHERNWKRNSKKNFSGEKGQYQVILKKIDMPIVPKDQCLSLLRQTRLGPFYKLHDSFVCAGGEIGKDTCKGDGGSPLVCPIQGKPGSYEVTGLVAWGIGCGDATPGVYAGVAYAVPWITGELSQLGIRLES